MSTMRFFLLLLNLAVAAVTFGHAVVLSAHSIQQTSRRADNNDNIQNPPTSSAARTTLRQAFSTAYRPWKLDTSRSTTTLTPTARVVRGSRVTVKDAARSMAFVLSHNDGLCSASVIANSWLLLAGHCDFARNSRAVVGRHGTHRGTNHRVIGVYKHRDFAATKFSYNSDIALAKIYPAVPAGTALRLNKDKAIPRHMDNVYGFGYGWNEHGRGSKVLRTARFHYLAHQRCRQTVAAQSMPMTASKIHPTLHLCANEGTVGMGMCNGDSGGPLIEKTPAGFVQVGVSSYRISKTCGSTLVPDIYTRISSFYWWVSVTVGTAPGFLT